MARIPLRFRRANVAAGLAPDGEPIEEVQAAPKTSIFKKSKTTKSSPKKT